jgi:hypothetical protein
MKKVISFCLWGDDPKYCVGALKNAELREKIYPDWECHFYIQKDVPTKYIEELNSIDMVETKISEAEGDWKFTVERFKAIDGEDVERVIFRDTDSRLNNREAEAVKKWMEEDTSLHIMRDHPRHGNFQILAGMWGLKKEKFTYSMQGTITDFESRKIEGQYHYDQIFLASYVWPIFSADCTIHDEIFVKKPFPTKREGTFFVGQSFDENDETPQDAVEERNQYE